jgi:hypothetical protein
MVAGDLGLPHQSNGFPNTPDSTRGVHRQCNGMTLLSVPASSIKIKLIDSNFTKAGHSDVVR